MEPYTNNKFNPALFIHSGLVLLAAGLLFGLTGALQYIQPGFLKQYLSFEKIRPLHVSSVVFWIIISAAGSVLSYVSLRYGKLYSQKLAKAQFYIFIFSVSLILISYFAGIFGGREYWEFHPLLSLPLITGWLLFLVNVMRSVNGFRRQPVYVWMWLTGVVFFLFTFIESYLWLFPYFRNNIINDMTVQWKSYGSMVGSWNMLIYGCTIFLMDRITGSEKYSRSSMAFALYFLGLFNLMFNWGHHIYTLPTHGHIKHISYAVSMTELMILGRIIWQWKSSVSDARKNFHHTSYRFLLAGDIWIFLTLMLAIAMSVPAINVYTHGTHITVAHTMGATIGINTFLLLAIASDILIKDKLSIRNQKLLDSGLLLSNISLLVFWLSLIVAGILKAKWQMSESTEIFSTMMKNLRPFFIAFFVSGIFLSTGLLSIILTLIRSSKGENKNHLINREKSYVRYDKRKELV